jgi:hypothetical protein
LGQKYEKGADKKDKLWIRKEERQKIKRKIDVRRMKYMHKRAKVKPERVHKEILASRGRGETSSWWGGGIWFSGPKYIHVRTCTMLKNKCIFPLPLLWFIFNLRRKQNWSDKYMLHYKGIFTSSFMPCQ